MADLDPALVEKVARAICLEDGQDPDAMDAAIVCDIDSNPLPTWQAYEDKSRAALLSLPIPAAALNALARGEATVVSRTAFTQAGNVLFNLKQRMPGSKLQEPDLRSMAEVSALLDASPYAAKE